MRKTTSKVRRPAATDEGAVTPGSGNVFADLGLRDADELLAKADLAHTIQQLILAQCLSQRAAAHCLGVARPDLFEPVPGAARRILHGTAVPVAHRTRAGRAHRRAAQAALPVPRHTPCDRRDRLS
jgi:predicted XRE-type DNA-binding protein